MARIPALLATSSPPAGIETGVVSRKQRTDFRRPSPPGACRAYVSNDWVGSSTWDRLSAFGISTGYRGENIAPNSDPFTIFYMWSWEDSQSTTCDYTPYLAPLTREVTLVEGEGLVPRLLQMTALSQADLDQAVADAIANWDAGADGQIGMEEAIRALQTVGGLRPAP